MKPRTLHIYILIIIGLFISCITQAQGNLDSLENIVFDKNIHDTMKFDALKELTWEYRQKDTDRSNLYAKQLLTLSQKAENNLQIGIAYKLLAGNYMDQDYDLDTIIQICEKSLEFIQRSKNAKKSTLKASIFNGMALTYEKFGQNVKAFSLYQKAFQTAEEIGNKRGAVRILGNMAVLLKNSNDLETSKTYYLKAINYAKTLNDEVMISQLGNNLANIYFVQNKIDSALVLFEKALEVNKIADDEYFVALSLANIGRVNIKKKRYEIATTYLNESYEIATKIKDTYCIGVALSGLCENYYEQKKYAKVINTAINALTTLGENSDLLTRTDFYQYLSNSYEAQKNYELAFENRKKYDTFSDSLYSLEKTTQINNLEIKYQVAQKEIENQLLKTKQEAAQRTIRNRGYMTSVLILALLFALGWGWSYYQSNQQKKEHNTILEATVTQRTTDLKIANENLEKMNKTLHQANFELRNFNHIASHDIKEPIRNIGSYVGLISRKLPDDLKQNLQPYFDTIKTSTKQLYTLIEDFARYSSLSKDEKVELESVDLSLLVDNLKDTLKAKIANCNGQVMHHNLPKIESNNSFLFTTLKNLIENGLKYNESEIPTVKITYQQQDNNHQIIVSDNGIGIDKEYHKKVFEMFKRLHHRGIYEGSGLGLAIVQLSLEKINGTIHLESQVGKGSRFIITIPM